MAEKPKGREPPEYLITPDEISYALDRLYDKGYSSLESIQLKAKLSLEAARAVLEREGYAPNFEWYGFVPFKKSLTPEKIRLLKRLIARNPPINEDRLIAAKRILADKERLNAENALEQREFEKDSWVHEAHEYKNSPYQEVSLACRTIIEASKLNQFIEADDVEKYDISMDYLDQKKWIAGELAELKKKYRQGGRDTLQKAFDLCTTMKFYPLPEWIVDGLEYVLGVPSLNRKLAILEKAYHAGNLGALNDAVYWCNSHKQPLPEWAVIGLQESLIALALNKKSILSKWSKWLRDYKQKMSDYEIYETVLAARKNGAEWEDSYEIAAAELSGKLEEDGGKKPNTVRDRYKETANRIEANPYQYTLLRTFRKRPAAHPYDLALWTFIKDTIKAGKPKGIKKQ